MENVFEPTDEQRALNSHVIVKVILECMDKSDLYNFRQVNRTWNEVSCKILKVQDPRTLMLYWETNLPLQRFNDLFNSSPPGLFSLSIANIQLKFELRKNFEQMMGHTGPIRNQIARQPNYKMYDLIRKSSIKQVMVELDLDKNDAGYLEDTRILTNDRHALVGRFVRQALELIYIHCPKLETLKLNISVDIRDSIVFLPAPATKYFQTVLARFQRMSLKHLKSISFDITLNPRHPPMTRREVVTSLFSNLLKTLFSTAPDLETVEVSSEIEDSAVAQFFVATFLTSFVGIQKLKSIMFHGIPLSDENLDRFSLAATADFASLKEAILTIDSSLVSTAAFKNMLLRTSGILEDLNLEFTSPSGVAAESFPPLEVTMEKLQSLTLTQFHGNIVFERLPKLDSLSLPTSLFECLGSSSDQVPETSVPLTKLSINIGIYSDSDDDDEDQIPPQISLPSVMRNLTHLTLAGTTPLDLFSKIFEECKQLVSLHLNCCQAITDEVLCGLAESEMIVEWPATTEEPRDIEGFRNLVQKVKNSERTAVRGRPFIGDLTLLENLFVAEFPPSTFEIDICVLFGVMFCRKLKELTFECVVPREEFQRAALILDLADLPDLRDVNLGTVWE